MGFPYSKHLPDDSVQACITSPPHNGEAITSSSHRWHGLTRNKRSVWRITNQPYREAHFATMPEDLVKPCVLAESRPGDVILDPFGGSGTVGKVAIELGRRANSRRTVFRLCGANETTHKGNLGNALTNERNRSFDSLAIVGSCFSLFRLCRPSHLQEEQGRKARRNAVIGLASFLVYALGRLTLFTLNQ